MRDFNRRGIIGLVGGAAAWPLAARAQQPRMPIVGFLNSASPEAFASYVEAFLDGLKETGFAEGQNVAVEYRWARGRYDQLGSLAADLAARKVDVIVASGEPSVSAAKAATSTIPIVFLVGGDPVQLGLVSSFNRPRGNATGVTILTISLDLKRLGLLRDTLAAANKIAVLINPSFPGSDARVRDIERAAHSIGQDLVIAGARNEEEINRIFADWRDRAPDALLVAGDPFLNARRDQIVALAASNSTPAIYEFRDFAVAGGLMSYGTHLPPLYRQQGAYAGRILRGAKPAEIPVWQPSKIDFVINLKTAKSLDLTIPPGVLAIANEVIE